MRTMLNRKPKKTIPPPENEWQLKVFKIVSHSKFEVVVFSVIVLNMVTLALEHYQMSDTWKSVLRYVDIAFAILFSLEAFLKIFGTRFYYFRDPFNVFDFVVVLLSITGFILEELLTFLVSPTLLRVVRVFRVFRVLRVIRAARGIRRLILTLMISLPALFNIAVLLGVFMVIFAILGMSFFMDVKLRGALNDIVNFRTFGNSMMLLFRLMTSAGWNDVLEPLMNDSDCSGDECGKYHIAIIYFVAYIFLVFLVVVNMYIAIILENFDEIFQQEESGVGQDDFEFFYVVWGRYDPKASQFVSIAELSNLLHSLHPPFQLAKPNEIKIAALNLPIVNGDKVHCLDVLFALVKRIMGEVEISDQMRQEAEARLLKSFPNRKSLKAETTTLALRQRVKAAKIIQEAWRGFHGKRKRGTDSSSNELFSMSSLDEIAGLQATSKFTRSETVEEKFKKESSPIESNGKLLPEPRLQAVQENKEEEVVPSKTEVETGKQSPQQKTDLETTKVGTQTTSRTSTSHSYNPELNRKNSPLVDVTQNIFPKSRTFTAFEREKYNSLPERKRSLGNNSVTENRSDALVIENAQTATKGLDNTIARSTSAKTNADTIKENLKVQKSKNSPAGPIPQKPISSPSDATHNSPTILQPKGEGSPLSGSQATHKLNVVRGKDLRFNPKTGQFKTKAEKSDAAENDLSVSVNDKTKDQSKEIDQSIVIENSNASSKETDV